jgi:hypothetical protein
VLIIIPNNRVSGRSYQLLFLTVSGCHALISLIISSKLLLFSRFAVYRVSLASKMLQRVFRGMEFRTTIVFSAKWFFNQKKDFFLDVKLNERQ